MVICLGRGADLHTAQLMPLCHSLSIAPINPDCYIYLPGITFLVLAHPGSPGQYPEGRKMVVVVVATRMAVSKLSAKAQLIMWTFRTTVTV